MQVWRIATDTPSYGADDPTGKGAEITGGRWNQKGIPLIYASCSRALCCLETLVHLDQSDLPLNRYLVEITIPDAQWEERTVFDPGKNVGWDAGPAGLVSLDWGTRWATSQESALAEVPSVIVFEEKNILINPRHPGTKKMTLKKVRRFSYDARFRHFS